MILPRLVLVALLGLAAPLGAQTAPDQPQSQAPVDRLGEVMQLDALFAVLREEGLAYGETLQADMFPAGGGRNGSRQSRTSMTWRGCATGSTRP